MKNILINLFFFICGILFRYLWIGENYNIVDITIIVIFMTINKEHGFHLNYGRRKSEHW